MLYAAGTGKMPVDDVRGAPVERMSQSWHRQTLLQSLPVLMPGGFGSAPGFALAAGAAAVSRGVDGALYPQFPSLYRPAAGSIRWGNSSISPASCGKN